MKNVTNRENMLGVNMVDGRLELDLSDIKAYNDIEGETQMWDIVRPNEECRPDLLSYRIYGTSNYWWVLMWFNGIADPWNDLLAGVALNIPSQQTISDWMRRATDKAKKQMEKVK